MQNVTSRLLVPSTAKKGDLIEIKSIVMHPMDSGFVKDSNGKTIPREIITLFTVAFNGAQVFKMQFAPSISSNPFVSFFVKVDRSGTFEFTWTDQDGSVYKNQAQISVT
ncbi:thiosulfate oxidation carrier complex protein SoxZ [bacterium]|nr:MAG: thiosulfate oxidation carrier complex protein SoxZ [bacterium]